MGRRVGRGGVRGVVRESARVGFGVAVWIGVGAWDRYGVCGGPVDLESAVVHGAQAQGCPRAEEAC